MNLSNRGRWLIDRYLDDGLAPQEISELEELLQKDPETAATFVVAVRLDAALREDLATDREAAVLEEIFRREEEVAKLPVIVTTPPPVRTDDTPALWTAWSRLVPTLVIVAAAILIAVALLTPQGEETPPMAKVLSGKIALDGKPEQEIPADRLFTVAGRESATLQLSDGSRMTIQPEGQAILHRPEGEIRQRVELKRGVASFSVEKRTGSFRVESSTMRLMVVGTEFYVRVIPASGTGEKRIEERAEVIVAAGRVVVVEPHDAERVVLNAGQRRTFPTERPRPKVREGEERRDKPVEPKREKPVEPRRENREQPKREEPRRDAPRKEGVPQREVEHREKNTQSKRK